MCKWSHGSTTCHFISSFSNKETPSNDQLKTTMSVSQLKAITRNSTNIWKYEGPIRLTQQELAERAMFRIIKTFSRPSFNMTMGLFLSKMELITKALNSIGHQFDKYLQYMA